MASIPVDERRVQNLARHLQKRSKYGHTRFPLSNSYHRSHFAWAIPQYIYIVYNILIIYVYNLWRSYSYTRKYLHFDFFYKYHAFPGGNPYSKNYLQQKSDDKFDL